MQFVLFIGQHKVGSSSIQDYMARNYVRLVQSGILYPMIDAEGQTMVLARQIMGYDMDQSLPMNIREGHNALAYRLLYETGKGIEMPEYHRGTPRSHQMFRTIKKQIEYLQPEAVILAGEVFSQFGAVDPSLIRRMLDEFPDASFRVIATLRRPDAYLPSWHSQRLRYGEKIRPLNAGGAADYFPTIHFDYRHMLQGWVEELYDTEIVLRDYREVLAAGGSVEDFKEQSCLNFPANLETYRETNPSLHRALAEIGRLAFHELDQIEAFSVLEFLTELGPQLDLPYSAQIEMFGTEVRRQMFDAFQEPHRYISDLCDRDQFFEDIDEMLVTLPVPQSEASRAAKAQIQRHANNVHAPLARDWLKAHCNGA